MMPIKRVRVLENDPLYPGFSRITASYMRRNMYNPYVFPVNSTTIEVRADPQEEEITDAWTDASRTVPAPCNRLDPEKPHRFFWRVVEGSAIILKANSTIILRTAILPVNLNWPDLIARFNEINSDTISAIGAGPGSLMLLDAYIPHVYLLSPDSTYIPIALGFRFEPSPGFSKTIRTQKFERVVYQIPIHAWNEGNIDGDELVKKDDPDDTTSDETLAETRSVYVDKKEGDEVELHALRESAFSGFFNLTWWQ